MTTSVSMSFIQAMLRVGETLAAADLVHVVNTLAWQVGAVGPHTEGLHQPSSDLFDRSDDQAALGISTDGDFLASLDHRSEFIRNFQRVLWGDTCDNHGSLLGAARYRTLYSAV